MIDGCARKGFDAVEFDNLDSWTRFDGTPLAKKVPFGKSQALAFARLITRYAHGKDMAVGAEEHRRRHAQAGTARRVRLRRRGGVRPLPRVRRLPAHLRGPGSSPSNTGGRTSKRPAPQSATRSPSCCATATSRRPVAAATSSTAAEAYSGRGNCVPTKRSHMPSVISLRWAISAWAERVTRLRIGGRLIAFSIALATASGPPPEVPHRPLVDLLGRSSDLGVEGRVRPLAHRHLRHRRVAELRGDQARLDGDDVDAEALDLEAQRVGERVRPRTWSRGRRRRPGTRGSRPWS